MVNLVQKSVTLLWHDLESLKDDYGKSWVGSPADKGLNGLGRGHLGNATPICTWVVIKNVNKHTRPNHTLLNHPFKGIIIKNGSI